MPVVVVGLLLGDMAIPTIILWLLTVTAVHVCVPVSYPKSSNYSLWQNLLSRLYALVAVAPIVAYTETDHDCMVHDVTRYQSAMSDLSKLYATDDDQGLGDWRAGPPDN